MVIRKNTDKQTPSPRAKALPAGANTRSVSSGAATNTSESAILKRLDMLEKKVASMTGQSAQESAQNSSTSRRAASSQTPGFPAKFWALNHLQTHAPEGGAIAFVGFVNMPSGETYAWQSETNTTDLLGSDWSASHARLSALAHPVRMTILKALLDGKRDTQSLQALPDMGTTGQLYHHLKELENAGWIRQPRRGEYNVLAERVVPLLTILAACEISKRT